MLINLSAPDKEVQHYHLLRKVKLSLEQTIKSQKKSRSIILLFFNLGARLWGGGWGLGVGVFKDAPQPLTSGKETRYPLRRGMSEPHCRFERVQKISAPPGFDPLDPPFCKESLYRLSCPG